MNVKNIPKKSVTTHNHVRIMLYILALCDNIHNNDLLITDMLYFMVKIAGTV